LAHPDPAPITPSVNPPTSPNPDSNCSGGCEQREGGGPMGAEAVAAASSIARQPRLRRAAWRGGGFARRESYGGVEQRGRGGYGGKSCGGELQSAEAAAARKQRGVEAAVALTGMVRKRLIGVLNKRPACRGCRDA